MEDDVACISKLITVLHSTLATISMTCQILQENCRNYQNVLKRWSLEVYDEKEQECICHLEIDEPEEMATDIQDAVEKAKAMRNVATYVKEAQTITNGIQKICLKPWNGKQMPKVADSGKSNGKLLPKARSEGFISVNKHVKSIKELKPVHQPLDTHYRRSTDGRSKKSSNFVTTYQKDFSVGHSQSKHTFSKTHVQKLVNSDRYLSCRKSTSVPKICVDELLRRATTSVISGHYNRLENEKMSTAVPNVSSHLDHDRICVGMSNVNCHLENDTIPSTVSNVNCPVHNELPTPKRIIHVGLREAIDTLGVPPELLKLLRTFHHYMPTDDSEHLEETQEFPRNSFLQKLNESNEKTWSQVSSEPVMDLYLQYFLVFVEVLTGLKSDFNEGFLMEVEEKIEHLNGIYCKLFDIAQSIDDERDNFVKTHKESIEDVIQKEQWALAGFWNKNSWDMFSGLKCAQKLYYSNNGDCALLQKNVQLIQRLQKQIEILETLENDIFPFLMNVDDDITLTSLYRVCTALCDIKSLSLPVLLKL